MNPLVQKIRENERLFEEKFVLAADRIVGYGDRVPSFLSGNQIKSYIRSCEISLLDTIEDKLEDILIDAPLPHEKGTKREGFFSGVTLIQNFIREAKKEI